MTARDDQHPQTLATASLLLLIAALMHFLVLRFVFPGYYAPLTPQSADFFAPEALANLPLDWLVHRPRPVGLLTAHYTGMLGIQGAIAAAIFVVLLNCVILQVLLSRAFVLSLGVWHYLYFSAFLFLVFAQPNFYTWAVEDDLASFSLGFLLIGLLIYHSAVGRSEVAALVVAFFAGLLGFLCKETFGLAAPVLAFVIATNRRQGILLAGVTFAAFVVVLAYGVMEHSPFLGANVGTYKTSLSLGSIVHIMLEYAGKGYSFPFIAIYVVAIGILATLALRKGDVKIATAFIALPIAGILAIAPSSLLPNHIYPGYSWQGAMLIFSPVLLLARVRLWPRQAISSAISVATVIVLIAASRLFFDYSPNWWTMAQEHIERNVLTSIQYFLAQPGLESGPKKVLVVGTPFNQPWIADNAMLQMLPNKAIRFDVVPYPKVKYGDGAITHWIDLADAHPENYDQVWIFRPDGTAVAAIDPKKPPMPADILGAISPVLPYGSQN